MLRFKASVRPLVGKSIEIVVIFYQCLITFAIIKQQVTTCMLIQDVFKNKAIRASRRVSTGTSGRSWSVSPIKCPVALAQIFSKLFKQTNPHSIHGVLLCRPCCFVFRALPHDSTTSVLLLPVPTCRECKHHSHTGTACRLILRSPDVVI